MPPAAVEELEKVTKENQAKIDALKKGRELAPGTPDPKTVFGVPTGAPTARKGENIMSSRGFSLLRMVKASINPGHIADPWDEYAKIERDVHQRIKKSYGVGIGNCGFEGGHLAPFSSSMMPDSAESQDGSDLRSEVKGLLGAGVHGFDFEEALYTSVKIGQITPAQASLIRTKASAQSWNDQSLGGALVGPPAFGEPVELWRNQAAMSRLGATVGPMPASGAFVAPRQTTASLAYWAGEAQNATGTNVGTDQITWRAKKLIAMLRYSREILQFGGPAAEMLFRSDLSKSIALGLDLACLEGQGSNIKPQGVIETPGIGTVTLTTDVTTNKGALFAPQDVYKYLSVTRAANAPAGPGNAFAMRPETYYALLGKRVDAVTGGDAAGLFAFSPFRALGNPMDDENINGYRVVTSNQINKNRVQGTSTDNTYVVFGYWPDYLILMSAVMEFIIHDSGSPDGGTDLARADQFVLKTLVFADGAARHGAGFAWTDNVDLDQV